MNYSKLKLDISNFVFHLIEEFMNIMEWGDCFPHLRLQERPHFYKKRKHFTPVFPNLKYSHELSQTDFLGEPPVSIILESYSELQCFLEFVHCPVF
jgi:hypothetical protein